MASFKAKLPVFWELIADVRKIAKLMNTQRFDILSNDVIDHMMSFDILSNDVIYRNVGYSLILLFFAHHYYQYLSYNYIMLTLGVIGRTPQRSFWAPWGEVQSAMRFCANARTVWYNKLLCC